MPIIFIYCYEWLLRCNTSSSFYQWFTFYLLFFLNGILLNVLHTIVLLFILLAFLQWRHVLQVPQPHKKGVTCITGIMVSETDVIFASTSSDGTINVWELILPSTIGGESAVFFLFIYLFYNICFFSIGSCFWILSKPCDCH